MGTKIRDLTATTSVGANDFLVVAKSDNTTKKISGANLTSSLGGGGVGELYIYSAGIGNMSAKSYQTYVDTASSPKQAYDTSKTLYLQPFASGQVLAGNVNSLIKLNTPPNMAATIGNITGASTAGALSAWTYNGFVYVGYEAHNAGGSQPLVTSPFVLIQV